MPVAFLMGVDWSETQKVSRLLGVKVLFNEVLAFLDLGEQRRLGEISVSKICIFFVIREL